MSLTPKLNKRDLSGAIAKIEKAGLTLRQIDAYSEHVIREAIVQAEFDCVRSGFGKQEVLYTMLDHSVLVHDDDGGMRTCMRVLAFWFHEHHSHLRRM